MGRRKKDSTEPKVGTRVRFVCGMGVVREGKIIKSDNMYKIETKDRYYYFDKIKELLP